MILSNSGLCPSRGPAKPAGSSSRQRGFRVLCAAVCFAASVSQSDAGLKIYYLRHAEAGNNVVKQWEEVRKNERPGYVGNSREFTPKGEEQVAAVPKKLQQYHFNFIAVSPTWRTRHTILPYLKATSGTGEIWPELHEFGGGFMVFSTNLPAPIGPILNAGSRVQLPSEEAPYFRLRADGQREFKVTAQRQSEHDAGVRFVVQRVIDMIRRRFGGTDKSILLVGHSNSGKCLLRMLTNNKEAGRPGITNAGIWMVEQQADGQFKLKIYNDAPYDPSQAASAPSR